VTVDYLDTSFVLSLSIKDDINHEAALELEKTIGDAIVSKLVIAELYTYFSRVLDQYRAISSGTGNYEEYVEAMVQYSIQRTHARIINTSLDELLEMTSHYAPRLRLRTLDLLHVLAAYKLGANRIITLDKDYEAKSHLIKKWLGLEVVTPWPK